MRKIYEFDLNTGKWEFIQNYPNPEELYKKVFSQNNQTKETLLQESFYLSDKKPRYYQEIAINKLMEAIWDGKIEFYWL